MIPTIQIVAVKSDVTTDGLWPVKLRVTFARKVRYFQLQRYVAPENWDTSAGRFTRGHPEWRKENDVLRAYEQRAADAVRAMELDQTVFTFDSFRLAVFGLSYSAAPSLVKYLAEMAAELEQEGKINSAQAYKYTSNTISGFRRSALISDVSPNWLAAFEKHLLSSVSRGGAGFIMRTLRAACNKAHQKGIMPKKWQPFSEYPISRLKGDGVKKALTLEDIRRIENSECPIHLEFARDMFMLSFYLRGANLADIASLTAANISGGRIEYVRKKTKKRYSILANEKVIAMIQKYTGQHYLFPIYTHGTHVTAKQQADRLDSIAKIINKGIRHIGSLLEIDTERLTFYSARHSYATALEHAGVSRAVISQAMGHGSILTTEGYLKGFGDKALDKADELLV